MPNWQVNVNLHDTFQKKNVVNGQGCMNSSVFTYCKKLMTKRIDRSAESGL